MKHIIDTQGITYLGVLVNEENVNEIKRFLSIRNTEIAFNDNISIENSKLTYVFNKPEFDICTYISMRVGDYVAIYGRADNTYEYFPIGESEIKDGLYTVVETDVRFEDCTRYIKKYS